MSDQNKPDWKNLVPVLRQVIFGNRLFLTENEQQVLMFIFQRTRMFGKSWETIPLRHFTDGVWSRGVGVSCSRLRMKSNSVIGATKSLEDKGLIEIRRHPTKANQYRIKEAGEISRQDTLQYIQKNQPKLMVAILLELRRNHRRLPPAYIKVLEVEDRLQSESKNPQPSSHRDRKVVSGQIVHIQAPEIHPTNRRTFILKKLNSNLAPDGAKSVFPYPKKARILRIPRIPKSPSPASELELALIEASSIQDDRNINHRSRLDFDKIERSWDEGMRAHWPHGYIKLPQSAFRNLKTAVEERGLPADQLPPLISWLIKNWGSLRFEFSFDKSTAYGPETPEIKFIIKKLQTIYRRFLRHQELTKPIAPIPPLPRYRLPATPFKIDSKAAEASRIRLGLPKWDG